MLINFRTVYLNDIELHVEYSWVDGVLCDVIVHSGNQDITDLLSEQAIKAINEILYSYYGEDMVGQSEYYLDLCSER